MTTTYYGHQPDYTKKMVPIMGRASSQPEIILYVR